MELVTRDLYNIALVEPASRGERLCIISGYATATMASQHLEHIVKKHKKRISLELVIGMTPIDGISLTDHTGFQSLSQETGLGYFQCSYVMRGCLPIHSKVYLWLQGNQPALAFTGSPNYTQTAFTGHQLEILTQCNADAAWNYFRSLTDETIFCNHGEIEDYVTITKDRFLRSNQENEESENTGHRLWEDLPHIGCPLLQTNGQIHSTGGLNWGNRGGRNPNQAYIPVPAEVQRSNFFPERGIHFTCLTDDGKTFILVRAQENGKALETPTNNSLLGEYFRNRLGVPNGAFVTKDDLVRYGRTTVDFYKIDHDSYLMDFSSPADQRN